MNRLIVIAVISSVAISLVGLGAARARNMVDRRKVYRWLRSNTRDEPGESHVDLRTVSKGTRLPEERALRACMSDERIYRFPSEPDKWSVWRKEPQSIYNKRGIFSL